jgi:hypothetical protein
MLNKMTIIVFSCCQQYTFAADHGQLDRDRTGTAKRVYHSTQRLTPGSHQFCQNFWRPGVKGRCKNRIIMKTQTESIL